MKKKILWWILGIVGVLVIGGGAAGLAAAVTVGRKGVKVVLVERYGFCGGAAVAGLSGTICGLYTATDKPASRPEQIVFGFADEFASRMETVGGLTGPIRYGKTFTRVHDPLVWRRVAGYRKRICRRRRLVCCSIQRSHAECTQCLWWYCRLLWQPVGRYCWRLR